MDKKDLLYLSSDLKRICQSIQRNSTKTTKIFSKEAQKWLQEAKKTNDQSIQDLLLKVDQVLKSKNDLIKAENCLMYSVILQDRAISSK